MGFGLEYFYFKSIAAEALKVRISKMSGNKFLAVDKISLRIYKDCLANIPPLTNNINQSFETCTFSDNWKISEAIPDFKDGDRESAINNRYLPLIPSTAKVCERIALEQFMSYLTDNQVADM